jgi:hypothetical protein
MRLERLREDAATAARRSAVEMHWRALDPGSVTRPINAGTAGRCARATRRD